MELLIIGGRLIKELTEINAIQVEALAAGFTKSRMAAYFGMTEKKSQRYLVQKSSENPGIALWKLWTD